jgi:hypothetical protein
MRVVRERRRSSPATFHQHRPHRPPKALACRSASPPSRHPVRLERADGLRMDVDSALRLP